MSNDKSLPLKEEGFKLKKMPARFYGKHASYWE